MNSSNIIKLNKYFHAFQGYRVNIRRLGVSFARYFSALEYGGMEEAYEEAVRIRDAILAGLEQNPGDPESVFTAFRKPHSSDYPPGLSPLPQPPGDAPASCSLRCTERIAALQTRVCERLGVDRASALRLALYSLAVLLEQAEYKNLSLFQLMARLEAARTDSLPDWAAYASGKSKRAKE